jgi:hypothetical protein
MNQDRPPRSPLTGPCFYGTFEQRRAMERWENTDWTFLHWTEVPLIMAVMESAISDVVFIDDNGWAWKGPTFSRARLVPLEQCPPAVPYEWIVT